jgi:hypothetical protein
MEPAAPEPTDALGRTGPPESHPAPIETLHALHRSGDRPPLFVMLATDTEGHVLYARAYDAERYD